MQVLNLSLKPFFFRLQTTTTVIFCVYSSALWMTLGLESLKVFVVILTWSIHRTQTTRSQNRQRVLVTVRLNYTRDG